MTEVVPRVQSRRPTENERVSMAAAVRRPTRLCESVFVVAGFSAVAVIATWPLVLHPTGGFYGFGNDNLGGTSIFAWVHDATWGAGSQSFNPNMQYPFGWKIPNQALTPTDRLLSWVAGGPGEGLLVHNIQVFGSFVLAGCTMYVLTRYLTGSRIAGFLAGFIFTYSPYHLAVSMQYGSLAAIQWLPLYVLALLVAMKRPTWRNAMLAGAALGLVWLGSFYYGFFAVWFTAGMLVAYAVWRYVEHRRTEGQVPPRLALRFIGIAVLRCSAGAIVFLAIFVPLALPSLRTLGDSEVATSHPLSEAVRYSARPWTLFLPSFDNPVFGGIGDDVIVNHLYDMPVYEQSLYLGVVAVALAVVALVARRRDVVTRMSRIMLAVGVLIGLGMMIGPYIPLERSYWQDWSTPDQTSKIPWVGRVMFEVGPMFRFYSRNYVLVSVCLAALAGMGFAWLINRVARSTAQRLLFLGVALVLVWAEFANAPPTIWFDDTPPEWVSAVEQLPEGAAIVDYPVAALNTPRSLYYMFWQREHRRATVNPIETDEAEAFAAAIVHPDDPESGRVLHEAGVDYAVVHTDLEPATTPPYQPPLPDDSLPSTAGSQNPWFERVDQTPDSVIYRVRPLASPTRGVAVTEISGFDRPEPEEGGPQRWVIAPTAEYAVTVWGARMDVTVTVEFLASFATPRNVVFSIDERVLTVVAIDDRTDVTMRLGELAPGRYTMRLVADPPPQPVGGGDARSVGLRVRDDVEANFVIVPGDD